MITHRSRILVTAMLLASGTLSLFSAGCASDAQTGALMGSGGGAGLGAIIGHNTGGHTAEGALIGAGVGAITGYLVGNESDKAKAGKSKYDY